MLLLRSFSATEEVSEEVVSSNISRRIFSKNHICFTTWCPWFTSGTLPTYPNKHSSCSRRMFWHHTMPIFLCHIWLFRWHANCGQQPWYIT